MLQLKKLKKKKCKQCKNLFQPLVSLQYICTPKCAIERVKERAKLKEEKDWQERKREGLEKLKTLGEYEQEARTVFQKWVRLRDEDEGCISCGRFADRYDGGHFFDAGIYSGLIFHEDNCHKQCSRPCNKDLHGNKLNYRIGLIKKIGEEKVKWLEENKDRLRNYSYSKEELIEIKFKYKQKIKEL